MANSRRNRIRYRPLKTRGQSSNTIWLWLLTGLFVGILGAALIYMTLMGNSNAFKLKHSNQQISSTSAPTNTKVSSTNTAAVRTTATAGTKDPKQVLQAANTPPSKSHAKAEKVSTAEKAVAQNFDFYNLLPKMEISNPIVAKQKLPETSKNQKQNTLSEKPSASERHAAATAAASTAQYILQVGVFRKPKEADTLKANLALQGFAPTIQKIQARDGAWFRVAIGPFASEASAQKQKIRLEKQRISTVLVLQQ